MPKLRSIISLVVWPFWWPIDDHGQVAETREAADDRGVLVEEPVAVELLEVVEDVADVLERVRPLDVAGELDDVPGGRRSAARSGSVTGARRAVGVSGRPSRRPRERVELEQLAERAAQVLARLDEVEHAVLEQELGRLEARRAAAGGSSARSPSARRSRCSARGSAIEHVAERRERGADAAVGRVGEQAR